MGCNTSQELKTRDGNDAAATNGESECTAAAAAKENGNGGSAKSDDNTINHHKHSKINNIDGSCMKKSNGHSPKQSNSSASSEINGMKSKQQEQINDKPLKYNNGMHCDNKAEDKKKPTATNYTNQNHHNDEHKFRYNNDTTISTTTNDVEDEAKAATKIQAVFRGHQVRKTTMNKVDLKSSNNENGASANQTEAEPTKAELEAEFDPNDKELCEAASKIQATFRGHLQRKMVNKDAPDDEDIQEITKKVAEELDIDLTDPELNKAATKIQASFRGHKTRKDATTD